MKFKDTKYGDLTGQTYKGDIDVSGLELTSLEGAPKTVSGYFDCSDNKLTTLEGAPKTVSGHFSCSFNRLKNLKGAPERVDGNFDCSINHLISLEGYPKVPVQSGQSGQLGQKFFCFDNPVKHLNEEYEIRRNNPNLSEFEIKIELVKRGFIKSEELDGLQDIFFL